MIVRSGQSLCDICLQEYGSYDGITDLIRRNAVITSIDWIPEAGIELNIGTPINKELVAFLKQRNMYIVTSNVFAEDGDDDGIFSEEFSNLFG